MYIATQPLNVHFEIDFFHCAFVSKMFSPNLSINITYKRTVLLNS